MGGSRIAIRLAHMAADEFRIKIIDNDMAQCRRLPEKCPNCDIVYGDARDIDVLRDEGVDEADAFIAFERQFGDKYPHMSYRQRTPEYEKQ